MLGSFSPEVIAEAVEMMKRALNDFNFANASEDSPKQVGLENPDMAAMAGWTVLDPASSPTFSLNTNHVQGMVVAVSASGLDGLPRGKK